MSQFKTPLYPDLFEIGGALTSPYNKSKVFDRSNLTNGKYQVREALTEIFRDKRTNSSGPWNAIVLFAEIYIDDGKTKGPVNFYTPTATSKQSKYREYIKVYARRSPEDQNIPQPDWSMIDPAYTNPQRQLQVTTAAAQMAIVKMHPFYLIPKDMWEGREPVVGDLIRVTFDDIINQTRGRLLEFVDTGNNPPGLTTTGTTSGPNPSGGMPAFADLNRPISTVFTEDKGPQIRPPTPEQYNEAKAIVDRMCPGPNTPTPNGLQFSQAGPPRATVQTIIWSNGRVLYRDMAPYFVAMVLAAHRDGVNLYLTNSFRMKFENVTGQLLQPFLFNDAGEPNDCAKWDGSLLSDSEARFLNKVKSGPTKSFSASQGSLRKANCKPKEQALTTNCTCNPVTGFPSNTSYPYGHGSGYANDISSGMGNVGSTAQPNVSPQVRWLSLNAWKFGFVRSVPSERWHWELQLGKSTLPHMFYRVPRNHGSWDNQFTNPNYANDMKTSEDQVADAQANIDTTHPAGPQAVP